MSLMRCPECKKKVSESAECCPHCGFSLNKPGVVIDEKEIIRISFDVKRFAIICSILIALFIIGFILLGIILSDFSGPDAKYYYLLGGLIIVALAVSLYVPLFFDKKRELILTNKRITGKLPRGFFHVDDFDYPLSTVKSIITTSFFGTGTIIIKFYEGFLSSSWIKIPYMKNVKEFKNKFFEVGK